MTESAQESISRVLKSNAGEFEKNDIRDAALVGLLIGLINFILDLLLIWRAEEVFWFQYISPAYGLMLMMVAGLVFRRSSKATAIMFGMLMAGVLSTFLGSTLGEQINVIGIAAGVIWGLIVWFKVYPAFDAIKVLAADGQKPFAPVGSALELVIVALGAVMLVAHFGFQVAGLFL